MLHYDPQHVSSSTLLILRRTDCITTASGIVTLCKQPYSMHTVGHVVHCALAAGSANVKVQNIFHGRNNITRSTDCKYRTAATLYTVETWFGSGV
jgi:hypothetical protein